MVAHHVFDHLVDVDHGDGGLRKMVGEIGNADTRAKSDNQDFRFSFLEIAASFVHHRLV